MREFQIRVFDVNDFNIKIDVISHFYDVVRYGVCGIKREGEFNYDN